MPSLDDQKKAERKMTPAQEDPAINPRGVYSGMTKRNALDSGAFVMIENMPSGVTRRMPIIEGTSDVED